MSGVWVLGWGDRARQLHSKGPGPGAWSSKGHDQKWQPRQTDGQVQVSRGLARGQLDCVGRRLGLAGGVAQCRGCRSSGGPSRAGTGGRHSVQGGKGRLLRCCISQYCRRRRLSRAASGPPRSGLRAGRWVRLPGFRGGCLAGLPPLSGRRWRPWPPVRRAAWQPPPACTAESQSRRPGPGWRWRLRGWAARAWSREQAEKCGGGRMRGERACLAPAPALNRPQMMPAAALLPSTAPTDEVVGIEAADRQQLLIPSVFPRGGGRQTSR